MAKGYTFSGENDEHEEQDALDVGVEVDLEDADKEDKRYQGDDKNPIDKDTGESAFDDLTPRFKRDEPKKKGKDEDSDEDESEETTDEDDEEEELDEEEAAPKGGSSSWKKRLLRAERLINEVRDENKELAQRNDALETKLTKRESEEQLNTKRQEIEGKLVGIRTKLKAAKEAGDTDAELTLTEEMADLKADLRTQEAMAKNAKAADEAAPPVNRQARLARQWIRRHQRYQSDAPFQNYVKAIDKQVAQEGYDPTRDEYWEELDRRVRERFPEEYKGRQKTPPRKKHPAGGGNDGDQSVQRKPRDDQRFARRGNKVLLTPAQLVNMRRFGMDPDNAQDRKDYVINNLSAKK